MLKITLLNKEQAINILFAIIDQGTSYKVTCSDETLKLIDEAKDYVLRNLK